MTDEKRKAIFVLSEKGGVGKSTQSDLLVGYFRNKFPALRVLAFDADPNVGHLRTVHGIKKNGVYDQRANVAQPDKGVICFDVKDKKEGFMSIDLIDFKPDVAIIDMPAGSANVFKNIFGNGDVSSIKNEYKKEGIDIVIVIVIDALKCSADNVKRIIEVWGNDVQYVVARNLSRGENFIFFEGYDTDGSRLDAEDKTPKEMLVEMGGSVIDIPALDADTYALINANGQSFYDAANPSVSHLKSRGRRSVTNEMIKNFERQMESLGWV